MAAYLPARPCAPASRHVARHHVAEALQLSSVSPPQDCTSSDVSGVVFASGAVK